jgi:virulence-associated protein VagC
MKTTVFKSGNSLCVRLPKGFELPIGKILIEKHAGEITLKPEKNGYPAGIWDYFRENADDTWELIPQPAVNEIKEW